ncbi:hypothetical protein SELMODRAFT_431357 [Selaginella moellendorffii]|uniref:Uncharacterized protein n=1 Tax=Selaginella moellendorffii TaxID=88036 RepID=D8TCC2_SELML|nr:hypothetical protein SELMODRAFT_431357 [Selaginella moellendorffii]
MKRKNLFMQSQNIQEYSRTSLRFLNTISPGSLSSSPKPGARLNTTSIRVPREHFSAGFPHEFERSVGSNVESLLLVETSQTRDDRPQSSHSLLPLNWAKDSIASVASFQVFPDSSFRVAVPQGNHHRRSDDLRQLKYGFCSDESHIFFITDYSLKSVNFLDRHSLVRIPGIWKSLPPEFIISLKLSFSSYCLFDVHLLLVGQILCRIPSGGPSTYPPSSRAKCQVSRPRGIETIPITEDRT